MSSFVCSQQQFENVRTSLEHYCSIERGRGSFFSRLIWPNHFDYVFEKINQTVALWQRINIETVAYQYAHGDKDKADKEIQESLKFTGKFKHGKNLTKVELFKSLSRIRYQIETEHLPRDLTSTEKEAMKLLETLYNELPRDIVMSSEEYDKAPW